MGKDEHLSLKKKNNNNDKNNKQHLNFRLGTSDSLIKQKKKRNISLILIKVIGKFQKSIDFLLLIFLFTYLHVQALGSKQ